MCVCFWSSPDALCPGCVLQDAAPPSRGCAQQCHFSATVGAPWCLLLTDTELGYSVSWWGLFGQCHGPGPCRWQCHSCPVQPGLLGSDAHSIGHGTCVESPGLPGNDIPVQSGNFLLELGVLLLEKAITGLHLICWICLYCALFSVSAQSCFIPQGTSKWFGPFCAIAGIPPAEGFLPWFPQL